MNPARRQQGAPYSNVPTSANRGKTIDMHEELRKQIYAQSGTPDIKYGPTASTSTVNATVATVPGAGMDTVMLYFDSARKVSADNANGTLSFSIPAMNNNVPVTNCVAIRILDFYFPRMTPSSTQPDIWFFKRAMIRLISTGISTTAIQSSGNSQHHFEFEVGDKTGLTNIAVDFTPVDKGDEAGIFRFSVPQTSITDISFQFLRPLFSLSGTSFTPIQFPVDTFAVQSLGGAPAAFRITTTGVTALAVFSLPPTTPLPYVPPAPGFAVFITSIAAASSPFGYFVTNIQADNLTLEIASLAGIPVGPGVMLVGANRIAFRAEFICSRAQATNFISMQQS